MTVVVDSRVGTVVSDLEGVVARMLRLHGHEVFGRIPIGTAEWDAELWRAGRAWMTANGAPDSTGDKADAAGGRTNVYLATTLYTIGGHTALIGDFVRAVPGPAHVVLTDIDAGHAGGLPQLILDRLGVTPADVTVLAGATLDERAKGLLALLSDLRPGRVFLFHHPHDPLPSIAAQPALAPEWWLIHHADAVPSFGLHVPGIHLIDLHQRAAEMSRLLGRRPWLVQLTAPDPGARPVRFLSRGRVVTASSGSAPKYEGRCPYGYAETIAEVLRVTGGWHLHVGPLAPATVDGIATTLAAAGLPPGRFIHVQVTPSVPHTLWEHGCDVYLASFPIDGARARVEVLASGTPYLRYGWRPDGDPNTPSPTRDPDGMLVWRTWPDLIATLREISTPDRLAALGARARAIYEAKHHPVVFRARLGEVLQPGAQPEHSESDELPPGAAAWMLRRLAAASPSEGDRANRTATTLQGHASDLELHVSHLRALDEQATGLHSRMAALDEQAMGLHARVAVLEGQAAALTGRAEALEKRGFFRRWLPLRR